MMSTTVHRIGEHRCFSFIVMTATSLVFLFATLIGFFNPMTVFGAQSVAKGVPGDTALMKADSIDIHSTVAQTDILFNLTNTSGKTINSLTVGVFYSRPSGYMPHGSASCSTPVLSYTPSNSVAAPLNSCPWFTCNYLTWSPRGNGECSSVGLSEAQLNAKVQEKTTATATFESLPPSTSTTAQADTYMSMTFSTASLIPGAKFGINGCIYYDNWPRFSAQKNTVVVFSGKTLLWGTVPSGINLQNIVKANSVAPLVSTGWGRLVPQ